MSPKLSVVIAYYKDLKNLKLILKGLEQQSMFDFEVIIAEDDNNTETIAFIDEYKNQSSLGIQHVFQSEDDGFRKNAILNEAIKISRAPFIAFVDGDCIPHRHFVKEYVLNAKDKTILYGRRVMLGQNISLSLNDDNIKPLNVLSIFLSDSKMKEEALYLPFPIHFKKKNLLGCNWCISKKDLIEINGFDEDYILPGVGEDVDIEWRLKSNGCNMFSMRNKAIVYHVSHPRSYNEEGVQFNYRMMDIKMNENNVYCINGIKKR